MHDVTRCGPTPVVRSFLRERLLQSLEVDLEVLGHRLGYRTGLEGLRYQAPLGRYWNYWRQESSVSMRGRHRLREFLAGSCLVCHPGQSPRERYATADRSRSPTVVLACSYVAACCVA